MKLLEELLSVQPFSLAHPTQIAKAPRDASRPLPNIAWRGEFFSARSFAHVNRESVRALIAQGASVRVIPNDTRPEPEVYEWPSVKAIQPYIATEQSIDILLEFLAEEVPPPINRAVVTSEPTNKTRPRGRSSLSQTLVGSSSTTTQNKKTIYLVVWESFLLPQRFVEAIMQREAQVWAPSSPVIEACLRSQIPAERISLIPHGVDLSVFTSREQGTGNREQSDGPDGSQPQRGVISWPACRTTGIHPKETTFLFSGVAHYRKGVDVAVRAFQEEFANDEPVRLIIKDAPSSYGWGANLHDELQALRDERITYLVERYSSQQMAALYRSVDIVIAPSRGEGFNIPIVEAMACGRPVIATMTGVTPDLTRGFLPVEATPVIDPSWREGRSPLTASMWLAPSVPSLRQQMRLLFEDKELRARLGQEALKESQRYSWERIGELMIRTLSLTLV